jgi:hypothetical protein
MSATENLLLSLAESYTDLLSDSQHNRKLAHHMALVASENWLVSEFAFLINDQEKSSPIPEWTALREQKLVDITLLPSPESTFKDRIHLEFKIITPGFWRDNWKSVYYDLAALTNNKNKKPKADAAVCFLINPLKKSVSKQREDTKLKYAKFISSVPESPQDFRPLPDEHDLSPLRIFAVSPELVLDWPYVIHNQWPEGYSASFKILWITNEQRTQ